MVPTMTLPLSARAENSIIFGVLGSQRFQRAPPLSE
jgi:hypothetical protein